MNSFFSGSGFPCCGAQALGLQLLLCSGVVAQQQVGSSGPGIDPDLLHPRRVPGRLSAQGSPSCEPLHASLVICKGRAEGLDTSLANSSVLRLCTQGRCY